MENQNYQDEFEQFLQDEVKQHRMYPSDHIWKNIRTELHGERSWPALSFISLFIITALTVSTLLNNHPGKHLSLSASDMHQHLSGTTIEDESAGDTREKENYFTRMAPGRVTASTLAQLDMQSAEPETGHLPVPVIAAAELVGKSLKTTDKNQVRQLTNTHLPAQFKTIHVNPLVAANNLLPAETMPTAAGEDRSAAAAQQTALLPAVTTERTETSFRLTAEEAASKNNTSYTPQLNLYKKNSRVGIQFYFTPSTSYRKLSDQKLKEILQPATTAINPPLNQHNPADVNNVVRHKPAIGLELGFAVLYNMTNRLKFKTGVQLNVRQYYIETFQSPTADIATVSLINYRGIENISIYSPYNNNVGLRPAQLDNKLYQVSVPLGVQWDVLQGKHLGLNTEASVQPTFTLNKNVYLLSTDFKHYADGGSFLRKWNINTSVGLNVSYKWRGNVLQLGPQVRYQHLPTYTNLYPIKEYLLDYGIRVGLSKQLFK